MQIHLVKAKYFPVKSLCVVLLLFLLASCSSSHKKSSTQVSSSKTLSSKVKSGSNIQGSLNKMKKEGVVVLHYGQTVRIVMPLDSLFVNGAPDYGPKADNILYNIKYFLGFFDIEAIMISVYSCYDKGLSYQSALDTLSALQAAKVQSYFSYYNLDARLMVSEGKSEMDYVSTSKTRQGIFDNSRVEIVFRYLVPTNYFL